jgi:hypothetical protein
MQQRQSLIKGTAMMLLYARTTHQSDRIPTPSSNVGINRANERYCMKIAFLGPVITKKKKPNSDSKCDTDNLTVKRGG